MKIWNATGALVTDPTGVGRGKLLRAADLAKLYREGRPLPCSIMSLDITGEDVEETGLVWDIGDADKLAWPIAGTLKRAGWMGVPTAQLLLSLWELDGRPYIGDPRHVLASVVRRLEADGYTPVVAAELEFYVVDPARGPDGRLQPPKAPATGRRLDRIDVYSVTELEEFGPFIAELYGAARSMALPAETLISEYAPGQLEVVLRHRADALQAADEGIQWKRLVRGVAAMEIGDGVPPEYLAAAAKTMPAAQLEQFEAGVRAVYAQMARITIEPRWARYFDFGAGRVPEFLRQLT